MTNLQEVPTDELLSFQDYPSVHHSGDARTIPASTAHIKINDIDGNFQQSGNMQQSEDVPNMDNPDSPTSKSFWTIEYYQKFFDVDTKDVLDRIIASFTPKWNNTMKQHLTKPDLYGPFWISVTLIFTIAISGNIASYLQQAASTKYHWKYDFHLVSYAATTIFLYVTLVPTLLWGLLKWSTQVNNVERLEGDVTPGALELICIYGYSLFIYIPVSILWSIQISGLQWGLVLFAALVSGSVLLLTLMPALRLSRHKLFLSIAIVSCHLLLAAGFMLYFFHVPTTNPAVPTTNSTDILNKNITLPLGSIGSNSTKTSFIIIT